MRIISLLLKKKKKEKIIIAFLLFRIYLFSIVLDIFVLKDFYLLILLTYFNTVEIMAAVLTYHQTETPLLQLHKHRRFLALWHLLKRTATAAITI